ncbi:hypothetical protein [Micromonospora sp. DH14]|uniref:hypothetical protein n=1 Tax=Micromonospora sp. DH14 TaxID=3040120 RepID=UPI002441B17E|nr:hypothetical protein [Micromonospora sp. DH14]MDG9673993.1 hypothetical protein [Micromonospora sp. DH14]
MTDHERDAWLALAKLMFNLPSALDAQLLRDNHLTLFDYFVLSGLSMAPGRTMRLSDLASHLSCSLSRLSNVVKRGVHRVVRSARAELNPQVTASPSGPPG